MTASHRIIFTIVLSLFTSLFSVGCMDEERGQWGRWSGTVTPVHVISDRQEAFEVASLRIESGPAYNPQGPWKIAFGIDPYGNAARVPENIGGGSQPLLVVGVYLATTIRINDLSDGASIEVEGWMSPRMVTSPLHAPSQYGGFVNRPGSKSDFDHVIIMKRYRIKGHGKWIDVPLDATEYVPPKNK